MNDKAKNPGATGPVDNRLWKVGYSWVSKNFQLRTAVLVVPAISAEEANRVAIAKLNTQGLDAYRLTKTVEY